MTRILTILGTRPQFIKASVVSREIFKTPDIEEVVVHTGQHFDENMSEVFFQELEIPRPTYQLNISGGTHGEMIGRMLAGIEEVIKKERVDRVLVYGDSNSTLAGTLAAARLPIPIVHVEAGLRSFNRQMPEEINRIVTDHLSDQCGTLLWQQG
jgi:UDP-GlcNAc3NAcA epimerase